MVLNHPCSFSRNVLTLRLILVSFDVLLLTIPFNSFFHISLPSHWLNLCNFVLFLIFYFVYLFFHFILKFISWPCSFVHCVGNYVIWCRLFPGCYWVAYIGDDSWGIWIYYTLQVSGVSVSLNLMVCICLFLVKSLVGCWKNYLCSGFWPTLAVFLQKIPILGWLLQHPFVRSVWFSISCH